MSKRKTVLWLSILIAMMPFLGFPLAWKTVFYFVSGLFIAVNSYQINKHKAIRGRRVSKPKNDLEQESSLNQLQNQDIINSQTNILSSGVTPPPSVKENINSNHTFGA